MEFGLVRKIKLSLSLIILCIILCPLSKTFSEDKRAFTDGDLDVYRYGNGKVENRVIENTASVSNKVEPMPKANLQEDSFKQRLDTIHIQSNLARASK